MHEQSLYIELTQAALDAEHCRTLVADATAGAQVVFAGAVRNHNKGKVVEYLDYEAYAPMAVSEMTKIVQQAQLQFQAVKIALHHRTGVLHIGELAVVVAVSAHHRAKAFEACAWIIDTLKKDVPIWKREVYTDGETWISERP
jgi:molybdopterin synthase catalytic subunit